MRVDELVGALSLFVGAGSKSDKLSSIFDCFDHDHDGLIDKHTLFRYIRCVLAALCHLCPVTTTTGKGHLVGGIRSAVV